MHRRFEEVGHSSVLNEGIKEERAAAYSVDNQAGGGERANVSAQGGGTGGTEENVCAPVGQFVGWIRAEEAGTDRGGGPAVRGR